MICTGTAFFASSGNVGTRVLIDYPQFNPDADDPDSVDLAAAYTFQPAAALKALDQLGRHTGSSTSSILQVIDATLNVTQ